MQKTFGLGSVMVITAITTFTAYAQTEHYLPGSYNIRDFALPDAGFYGAIYNYGYLIDNLKGANGAAKSKFRPVARSGYRSNTVNEYSL